ncbi:MAG: hypothetical protein K2Y56_14835 [Methylobacterium sp.]|uniref:hypothetical protein n=1 Tax=Methylobacterium sp. TaxID=409 RepID=UPI0025F66FE7|nr:hypothetical protein [Methylobacterium sp.]MBX9932791.1 hypothetical protein [Methylobacterium sp.]
MAQVEAGQKLVGQIDWLAISLNVRAVHLGLGHRGHSRIGTQKQILFGVDWSHYNAQGQQSHGKSRHNFTPEWLADLTFTNPASILLLLPRFDLAFHGPYQQLRSLE